MQENDNFPCSHDKIAPQQICTSNKKLFIPSTPQLWGCYLMLPSNLVHLNFSFSKLSVYTRVQVERVYKSNPIFEAKNTIFLEKV